MARIIRNKIRLIKIPYYNYKIKLGIFKGDDVNEDSLNKWLSSLARGKGYFCGNLPKNDG